MAAAEQAQAARVEAEQAKAARKQAARKQAKAAPPAAAEEAQPAPAPAPPAAAEEAQPAPAPAPRKQAKPPPGPPPTAHRQAEKKRKLESLLNGESIGYMKVDGASGVKDYKLDKLYIKKTYEYSDFSELQRENILPINFVIKLEHNSNIYILCWRPNFLVSFYDNGSCDIWAGYTPLWMDPKSKNDCRYERIMRIINAIDDETFDGVKLEEIKSNAKQKLETFIKQGKYKDYYVKSE